MELGIKRGFLKTTISENDNVIYTVSTPLLKKSRYISNTDGKAIFTIGLDPKPLDSRIKYIFTEHETGNTFYAWTEKQLGGIRLRNLLSFSPIEYYIEAESFFGEIAVKRTGLNKFDITINGRKKGYITRNKIFCEEIDDGGLLAMIYVFSRYLAENERLLKAENLV